MKNIDTTKYFVIEDKAGVKTSNIFKEMQKLFDVWSYYDDTRLDNDFPAPQKTTTRYFEKNIEADLCSKKLLRGMNDEEILRELKPTEVSLGEVFNYLKNENDHSTWRLFYVKDDAGVLRAVNVYWHVDGWDVFADSVGFPDGWFDGFQVFSRNFETETLEPSEPLTLCPHCNKEIGVKIIKK